MRNVNMQILKPSLVTLPPHIKTLVIINRTIPENADINLIEGVITAESIHEDRAAVHEAINGVIQMINDSPRFKIVKASEELKGSGTGNVFPAPLDWSVVQKICDKYNAQALVAIETFDSDFVVTHEAKEDKKVKNDDGTTTTVKQFHAQAVTTVKTGFRTYDLTNKNIADQGYFSHNRTWNTKGSTLQEALIQLIKKSEAVKTVSYNAGSAYATRITPYYEWVSRSYYKSGNPHLVSGARKARVNDWQGAEDAWMKALNSFHKKVKGRAAYNIALTKEIQGDLQAAKTWAQRAYSEFGNKKAVKYTSILDWRINQQNILNQQMNSDQ
ncbi:MAG: DUF6340 family protein [Cytophagaceae bacterium]|nr:DUF6340 family protein [Cytophagaceae bacterium]MDW8456861.1 DUF6340 family protein [Cytophagaceae bacterium]